MLNSLRAGSLPGYAESEVLNKGATHFCSFLAMMIVNNYTLSLFDMTIKTFQALQVVSKKPQEILHNIITVVCIDLDLLNPWFQT